MLTAGAIVLGITPIAPTVLWSQARVCFAWLGWREAAP
jgi:hypothetical protein